MADGTRKRVTEEPVMTLSDGDLVTRTACDEQECRHCGAPAEWVYWRRHEHEGGPRVRNDGPHCTILCFERGVAAYGR